MSVTYFELYCDESAIGSPRFFFGAIRCSSYRTSILLERIAKVRKKHSCIHEMKWTKVSTAMLPVYKAFADVFLDDRYCSLHVMGVERGLQWRKFGRDEEARFTKSYYVFLRLNMSLYSRYDITVDDKPGKPYRWNQIRCAINGATGRDFGLLKTQVRSLIPLNSKRSDLLQLVDVLLGATSSSATSSAKVELANHVRSRLKEWQSLGKNRFTYRNWTPSMMRAVDSVE